MAKKPQLLMLADICVEGTVISLDQIERDWDEDISTYFLFEIEEVLEEGLEVEVGCEELPTYDGLACRLQGKVHPGYLLLEIECLI